MKEYKTVPVPPTTRQKLVKRVCDICGFEAKTEGWDAASGWDVNETEVRIECRQKEGESYPEGGWGTEWIIDICPECFKKKLVPALIEMGAQIKEEEWDW